ncbi:unnamed protein product [Aphanomyces euteiches]
MQASIESRKSPLKHSLSAAQNHLLSTLNNDSSFFSQGPGYEPARVEKLKHCCKRVRIWKKQIANPLVALKARSSNLGKKERRIHIAVLLNLILDTLEQCIVHFDDILTVETIPEYFANSIIQKANGRKTGVDQVQSTLASMTHMTTHPLVRAFADLCGIDTDFNPPEKSIMFLRCIEKVYQVKVRDKGAYEDITSITCVVFHNIALTQAAAKNVVRELFGEPDPYWAFQYLDPSCSELKVARQWPPTAEAELLESVDRQCSSTRGVRKIDGDSFLNLLLETWNRRAIELYRALDIAADEEDSASSKRLRESIEKCAKGKQVLPLEPFEIAAFGRLLDDFWLAEIPWTDPIVQNDYLSGFTRPLGHIRELFHTFRANSPHELWESWEWDNDWEWTGLELAQSTPPQPFESGQLNLNHFGLGDRGVQKMGQYLDQMSRRSLKTLLLHDNIVADKGCASVMHAITNSQHGLVCLDLSQNRIHANGAQALAEALQSPSCKLQSLLLAKNHLGDVVAKKLITAIAKNTTLRTLDLAENQLTTCGHALAHLLRSHPRLRHFDLSWNLLRGKQATTVASAVGDNNGLELLNVSYNAFGEDGLVALIQALRRNTALRVLNVAHNSIHTIREINQVTKTLRSNLSLQTLVLNGNSFGDDIIKALDEINQESLAHRTGQSALAIELDGCTLTTASTYLLPKASEDEGEEERPQTS